VSSRRVTVKRENRQVSVAIKLFCRNLLHRKKDFCKF
jgi:hypothetical protein